MRVHVKRKELREALLLVSGATSPRSTLPVLGNVRLEAADGRLQLQATDLEIGMTVEIGGVTVEQEGATTLPVKLLGDWVAGLTADDVALTLEARTETVTLLCGDAKAKIKGIPAKDFPLITRPSAGAEWQRLVLSAHELAGLVRRVAYAAAKGNERPTLRGVDVAADKDGLKMAATDGYRLAVAVLALPVEPPAPLRFIVPAHSLRRIEQICSSAAPAVVAEIFVAEDAVETLDERAALQNGTRCAVWRVSSESDAAGIVLIEVYTGLLPGKFPDYRQIVPKSQTTRLTLETAALVSAVRLASLFSERSIVRLAMNGALMVSAKEDSAGESESRVPCEMNGAELTIAFDGDFLREMAGSMPGQIVAEFTKETRPGLFYPLGATPEQGLSVLMPMHIG